MERRPGESLLWSPFRMTTKAPDPASEPDAAEAPRALEFVRSRTSIKRERVSNELALSELALALLDLNAGQLQALGLSDLAIEAITGARLFKSFAARGRQMRRIRARLRDLDWMQIRAERDRRRAGYIVATGPVRSEEARVWTEQLLVQGDPGLARFIEIYDTANRQRLRQLVRTVNQSGEAKRHKTRLLLLTAVEETIERQLAANKRNSTEEND